MSGSTTSRPFGRCGSSSRVPFWGGVATIEPAADQERLDVRVLDAGVRFSSALAGHESYSRPAVRKSVPGLPITDPRSAWVAKKRRACAASALPTAATSPHTCAREDRLRHQRHEPRTAAVAFVGVEERVDRPRPLSGPAPSVVACMRPKNAELDVALPDRQEPPVVGHPGRTPSGSRPRDPASGSGRRRRLHRAWRSGRICSPVVLASQRKLPGG